MRILRGLGALLILAVTLVAVPALLWVATAQITWSDLIRPEILLTPDDGTVVIALVALVGWAAWLVFAACVLTETLAIVSRHRIRISMPGLGSAQGWVAGLLISVAALVSTPLSAQAQPFLPASPHVAAAQPDTSAVAEPPSEPTPPPVVANDPSPDEKSPLGEVAEDEAPTLGDVAEGVGTLLAAALVGQITARRAQQLQERGLGRRITHPVESAYRLEQALGKRQDPQQRQRLQVALSVIGAHLRRRGVPVPAMNHVVIDPEQTVFHFRGRPGSPPPGFIAHERRWVLPRDRLLAPSAAGVNPWPALVTLGSTDDGHPVLVDLEGAALTEIDGPDPVPAEILHAVMLELCTVSWGGDTEVVVVGGDQEFVRGLELAQLRAEPGIDAALDGFERLAQERCRANVGYRRLDPEAGETWRVHALVIGEPFDEGQRQRLADLPLGAESGLLVVTTAAVGGSVLQVNSQGIGVGDSIPTIRLQRVSEPVRAATRDLFQATGDLATTPGPWWQVGDRPAEGGLAPATRSGEEAAAGTPIRAPGPHVLLLGPIDLVGAAGEPPARAQRQCIEYAAWLLENPGATAASMADSLGVAEGTRRSNMSRLRAWLGRDGVGELYLPEAYTGRIRLHPDVSSDWQQLQLLTVAGVNRAAESALIAALELVRGAPLADAAPGQWHWAEELRTDICSLLRDVGVVLTGLALRTNNLDLARWAAARALTAAPEDELLLCARVRTEYQAGHTADVHRLALRLTRHARRLNIDLADETITLLQQVMEGRPRPRRVTSV